MADKRRPAIRKELDTVQEILREFNQLVTWRNVFAAHWEEVALLITPTSRNTFFYGSFNFPGQKKTDKQVDATGMLALERFAAICDSLLTPKNMMWHKLAATDPYVMKDRQTRLWFEEVTQILFRLRYEGTGNFPGQNANMFQSLGAFGNSAMLVDTFDSRWAGGGRGLRYKSIPLGEMFFRENHQGLVDGFIRWFRLTAYQAVQKFGREWLPSGLEAALEQDSPYPYDFLHRVMPRDEDDYDPQRLDARGKPFCSQYVCIQGQCLMAEEGGYNSFPVAISRYSQTPGEVYGRSPAMMVLPALKTLNAEKRIFLTQGHRAAAPVLLTADDGIVGMDMRPNAVNKGGVTADGKPLVHTLPTGDIKITEIMMGEEKALIDDVFLVSLFKVLSEHPQMTATQVIELVNEKGILVAPSLGRQENEYLDGMVHRELDLASQMRLLPPMPPRLREAQGSYKVEYTSPLALSRRAGQAAGFMRTVESVKELVNITQDPSLLDPFDFDTAIPEIAQIGAVPERWMSDPSAIAQKRKARAKQVAQKQQIDAMPAQAAMLKAQATVAKAQPGLAQGQAFGGPQQSAA